MTAAKAPTMMTAEREAEVRGAAPVIPSSLKQGLLVRSVVVAGVPAGRGGEFATMAWRSLAQASLGRTV